MREEEGQRMSVLSEEAQTTKQVGEDNDWKHDHFYEYKVVKRRKKDLGPYPSTGTALSL